LKMNFNGGRNHDHSSKEDTRSNLRRTEKREVGDPLTTIEEAGGDFFEQLRVSLPDRCEKKLKWRQVRVWIKSDLVEKNFSVEYCFPAHEDERSDTVKVVNLSSMRGKDGCKPSFLKVERRCFMVDWGRGRGGGRDGRGRNWRP
jgi:hypothetical protein